MIDSRTTNNAMPRQNIDFLLIGQGLAGSILAHHLLEQGCSLHVLNTTQHRPVASLAAAGLYNPITGRKLVKTWRADDLFPYLETFYTHWEQQLGTRFLHPMPIYRPFTSVEEQNIWATQATDPAFSPYVQRVTPGGTYGHLAKDPLGGLLLQRCGYVDVPVMLLACRAALVAQQRYTEGVFDPAQLIIQTDYIEYGPWKARKLIFCDGASGTQNPFFRWLPFRPVKGEMLRIRTDEVLPVIMNRGVFAIPQGDICKVGSTYDHHDLSSPPTESGRQTLVRKLEQWLTVNYEIIDHWAGVRPATHDRRPFIGGHPIHEPIAIFNGFGTKGVSLAPYFAQHFVHCLLKNQPIDEAVDVRRCYHTYQAYIHSS